MSYMNTHAAFAPAGGIQELSFDEIGVINGSGFWEGVGEMLDNPWTTVGKFMDTLNRARHNDGFTYYANGIQNIK